MLRKGCPVPGKVNVWHSILLQDAMQHLRETESDDAAHLFVATKRRELEPRPCIRCEQDDGSPASIEPCIIARSISSLYNYLLQSTTCTWCNAASLYMIYNQSFSQVQAGISQFSPSSAITIWDNCNRVSLPALGLNNIDTEQTPLIRSSRWNTLLTQQHTAPVGACPNSQPMLGSRLTI